LGITSGSRFFFVVPIAIIPTARVKYEDYYAEKSRKECENSGSEKTNHDEPCGSQDPRQTQQKSALQF